MTVVSSKPGQHDGNKDVNGVLTGATKPAQPGFPHVFSFSVLSFSVKVCLYTGVKRALTAAH